MDHGRGLQVLATIRCQFQQRIAWRGVDLVSIFIFNALA